MIEEKVSNSPKYIVKRRIYIRCYVTFCNEKNFSGDIKHQFTYEVELNQETHYVNRNITVKSMSHQLSIADWIKRHSNYNVNHINYDPYIDRKHLVLVGNITEIIIFKM